MLWELNDKLLSLMITSYKDLVSHKMWGKEVVRAGRPDFGVTDIHCEVVRMGMLSSLRERT